MSWVKSNRWYLIAIAVFGCIAMLAAMSTDWFAYEERVSGRPVAVAPGETVDYSGAAWTLKDSFVVPASSAAGKSADLLAGTELVVASVRVNPSGVGEGLSCTVTLEDRNGVRTWDQARGSEVSVELDAGAKDYCGSDADTYLLQVMFIVPEGAGEGSRLLISTSEELPKLLAFTL